MAGDETASDELIGWHAAADTGDADPAPPVAPVRAQGGHRRFPAAPVRRLRAPRSRAPGRPARGRPFPARQGCPARARPSGPAWTGSKTCGPARDARPGRHGNGIPAAALSEQQWPAIQAMFVDDPQASVQRAAAAAEEVAKAFVASLQREQAALRASWENAGDATTEDLRTALQQYRAFCGRWRAWPDDSGHRSRPRPQRRPARRPPGVPARWFSLAGRDALAQDGLRRSLTR